jgi:hypothetical protein
MNDHDDEEHDEKPPGEDGEADDNYDHLDNMSDYELMEELTENIKPFIEVFSARIYVNFIPYTNDLPADEQGVPIGAPDSITLGPYTEVELSDGKMHVTSEVEEGYQTFCLATARGVLWEVHDGLERKPPFFAWARFHTVPPKAVDLKADQPPT